MTTKWTVAPWKIGQYLNDNGNYDTAIYGADQAKIAIVEQWIGQPETAECEANAELIAAAPEMVECLRYLVECDAQPVEESEQVRYMHQWRIAKALLQRIEGESQ